MPRTPRPVPVDRARNSVRDYPRRPRLEDETRRIAVVFNGVTIAETTRGKRVVEMGHPPTYYIPREDVRMKYLKAVFGASSYCEWKGVARYFHVLVGDRLAKRAAWSYPRPLLAFSAIRNYLAFYADPMDACYLGDERVRPEPGVYYGGWITDDIAGPLEGEAGTAG